MRTKRRSSSHWIAPQESVENASFEGFNLLYQKYERMVRSAIFNLSGANEVQDLVQETFEKIWRSRGDFRGASSERTWIYRIAVNVAIDFVRKSKRWRFLSLTKTIEDSKPIECQSWQRDLVRKGLSILSEEHRSVLVLHSLEGLTFSEVSEILKVPEGTVRSRLHYAKEKFLEFLEREKVEL